MGQPAYSNGFIVTLQKNKLELPLSWKKSRTIFVNSMSDLLHKDVPTGYIQKVFETMNNAYWHRFQVLTKRSERLVEINKYLNWIPNIWMGVSVENSNYFERIEHLKATDAKIKFLSLEPLLGPLPEMDLEGINWVIVGGESGPGARPINEEWLLKFVNSVKSSIQPSFLNNGAVLIKKRQAVF